MHCLLLHKFHISSLLPLTLFGGRTKALEGGTVQSLVLMGERTMISLSISHLFLLSFDSLLNIPLNNKIYSCFVTDYVNSTRAIETSYPEIAATTSQLFSSEMTVTVFLKEGRGSGDGFQALSQKCCTDPSLTSWQYLFLFLFIFLLNWCLFSLFFFF